MCPPEPHSDNCSCEASGSCSCLRDVFDDKAHRASVKGDAGDDSAEMLDILFLMDEFAGPDGGTEQHLLFLLRRLPRRLFRLHFAVLGELGGHDRALFPVEPIVLGEGRTVGSAHQLRKLTTRGGLRWSKRFCRVQPQQLPVDLGPAPEEALSPNWPRQPGSSPCGHRPWPARRRLPSTHPDAPVQFRRISGGPSVAMPSQWRL